MSGHLHRFFLDELDWALTGSHYSISDQRLDPVRSHLRALRLSPGEPFVLFNKDGLQAVCALASDDSLTVLERKLASANDFPHIHLIQCLPKGDAIEHIVAMVTELGARAIHLAISERTIARPDRARAEKQAERLQRIVQDAAAIGGQPWLAKVEMAAPLQQVAQRAPLEAEKIVFWEESKNALGTFSAKEIWVVIGPEGGLSQREINTLEKMGFCPCSLGPWVLRAPTAAAAAITLLSNLNSATRTEPVAYV